MDIIEKRKALAQALSDHNPLSVKIFLHPSFVVRGAEGEVAMDYKRLVSELPEFFRSHPEYKQTVEIESSKIDGDTAILLTHRLEDLRVLWWPHTVSSKWNETWKKVAGEWVLAEERPSTA